MATKPTIFPDWSMNNVSSDNIEPVDSLKAGGIPSGGIWGRQFLNWQFYAIAQWIRYVDEDMLDKKNNLSDVPNKLLARNNLGFAAGESTVIRVRNQGRSGSTDRLATPRLIGGVPFDGTKDIKLAGVDLPGTQPTSGNAGSATKLQTARLIGGVSFDGTKDINLKGVNTTGDQNTTGNAGSADKLKNARLIGGVSFDGTKNIILKGVNAKGDQDTTGTANHSLTTGKLKKAILIGGVSFDGSTGINLKGVNTTGDQNTTGNANTATKLAKTIQIGGVDFNGEKSINLKGVNTKGDQDTSGTAEKARGFSATRLITIGSASKEWDGRSSLSFTIAEIGAMGGGTSTGNSFNSYIPTNNENTNNPSYILTSDAVHKLINAIPAPDLSGISSVPVGSIVPFGGNSIPSGWLECNGTAVSQTLYADLYRVIGSRFDNTQPDIVAPSAPAPAGYFRLPDMEGRTVRGIGKGWSYLGRPQAHAVRDIRGGIAIGKDDVLVNGAFYYGGSTPRAATTHAAGKATWVDFDSGRVLGSYSHEGETRMDNMGVRFIIKF